MRISTDADVNATRYMTQAPGFRQGGRVRGDTAWVFRVLRGRITLEEIRKHVGLH